MPFVKDSYSYLKKDRVFCLLQVEAIKNTTLYLLLKLKSSPTLKVTVT